MTVDLDVITLLAAFIYRLEPCRSSRTKSPGSETLLVLPPREYYNKCKLCKIWRHFNKFGISINWKIVGMKYQTQIQF